MELVFLLTSVASSPQGPLCILAAIAEVSHPGAFPPDLACIPSKAP